MRGYDVVERNKSLRSAVVQTGVTAAAIAGLLVSGAAFAADWHINSSITGEFEYDDNFRLNADNEETLWGFSVRPRLGIEAHTPRTDLNVGTALSYSYFPDNTDENSFDQRGSASIRHRTSERNAFGFGGSVSRQTTRTSEVDDSGRNLSDAQRIGLGGNASWSHALTDRIGVGISGGASYVNYDTSALNDYRTFSGGPFLNYVLTEKDSLQFSAGYTRYDRLTGDDLESDLYQGSVSWTRALTPQLTGRVSGGANYVSTDEDVVVNGVTTSQSDDKFGYQGSVGLTYVEERASFRAGFSHSVVPSSLGRLQRRNSLNLGANYQATPVVTVGLTTDFIQQERAEGGSSDRNFVGVSPSVSWRFLPDWSARLAYRFRTQTLDDGDRAYSNGGVASVTWSLPSWGPGIGK